MSTLPFAPTLRINEALPDLDAWTTCFRDAEIPVLGETATALEALRANEDRVDANSIGEMISSDPLMTLKVLAYASTHRAKRLITDTETVTSALVMMGIPPFFLAFGAQPTIEERLVDLPDALAGLDTTLRRAHRGANFALAIAVRRMDPGAAMIHAATLLHDFAEMLLWCHAPALALRMAERQRADVALRSSVVQLELLNVELVDLQQSLMKAWQLPEALVRISDDRHADHAKARNVALAIRLARHTARGWDNLAIPDDIAEIATLLNLSPAATLEMLQAI